VRRAHTLIELLIALALGTLLAAAAWSAVRAASQAITVVTRLSIQNRLLRAGAHAALDDLDTWSSYDDPTDAARQPLRAPGEPFQPMALPDGDPRRWDDLDLALDADQSDARCWYRGAGVISNGWSAGSGREYGDYALHGRIDHPDAARRWSARMQRDIVDRLGFYALFELMPANTVFSWFDADGFVPAQFHATDGYTERDRLYQPFVWSEARDEPRELALLSCLSAASVTTAATFRQPGDDPSHRWFSNWATDKWRLDGVRGCVSVITPMPLRPATWPALAIDLNRWAGCGRFWAIANVTVVDPTTAERISLHLRTHTTTLLGARRQRHRDAGWARAGQPTLDDGT